MILCSLKCNNVCVSINIKLFKGILLNLFKRLNVWKNRLKIWNVSRMYDSDRSFVEHYQTSNSSAIDMWIQSDSCVICFPLVFSVEVSLSEHAIQTGTHVTQRDVQSEGLLYFCLVKCTLGPVFVVETADILWPHRIFRTKPSYLGQICFTEFELPSEANILNWPTKNLVEGQVSTFPGFAEDNTYRGVHKTVHKNHLYPSLCINITFKCC